MLTTLLAIDLGKFKSVACVYRGESQPPQFTTLATRPQAMYDLIVRTLGDESAGGWGKGVRDVPRLAHAHSIVLGWKIVRESFFRDK